MKNLLFLLVFSFFFVPSVEFFGQCTLTAKCTGGNWSAASTWTASAGCGAVTVPSDNTLIVIPACATVSVDINSPNYNNMQIDVYGTLDFGNGQKINMCPGTVNVYAGGKLTGGTPGSKINICGTTVWNGGGTTSGPVTYGGGTTLPIELLNFDAEVCGKNICLNWRTASEKNNDFFTVERSKNGIEFEVAAILDGAGNSSVVLSYSSIDANPYEAVSYYRLKQTDNNGDFTYSALRTVDLSDQVNFGIDVFPNPNNGSDIHLKINNPNGEILVVVFDASGREAYSKVIVTDETETVYAIDPSGKLSPGIYLITATSQDKLINKKLIVE